MKETASENVATLIDEFRRYMETKAELWKLRAIEKATDIISSLISQLLIFIILLMGVVALNIGIALLIGQWLGAAFYGFFAVAGFYLLLGLIIFLARNSMIKTPLNNTFIDKLLK